MRSTKNDPQSDVLVALLGSRGLSFAAATLAALTGWSETAVRNNLNVAERHGWVQKMGRPALYRLTEKGREVAGYRKSSR